MAITTIHEVPTGNESEAINVINQNFRVLTERIKNLNLQISYLDLIHITDIYEVTQPDPAEALAAFVRTQWTVLGNYDGICITDSRQITNESEETVSGDKETSNNEETSDDEETLDDENTSDDEKVTLFIFQGHKIHDGDYLVKLPDGQCVYIQNQATAKAYFPKTYEAKTGTITWDLRKVATVATITSVTITLATIPGSGGLSYANGTCESNGSFTPNGDLRETRWYTNSGEEVLWSGSHCTTTNRSGLTLNYSAITYITPTNSSGGNS